MIPQSQQQDSNFFDELTLPNPLQKKCLKPPLSIFPLVQLPAFSFSKEETSLLSALKQQTFSPEKTKIRSRSTSPKKKSVRLGVSQIFLVEETQLKNLFSNPIYSFSKRLSKGSNKNFCNIKVFPQESHNHAPIKDQAQQFFLPSNETNTEQNLSFESRFESGNLGMVAKSKLFQNEYYLLLTKDFNTARCTQWFFFRVLNRNKGKATFHILNFFKNYSSFEYGMQVCVSSKSSGYEWTRGGEDIMYRKTNVKANQKYLYCLSFTYDFKSSQNITYFSYSYPYPYSKLDSLLFQLEELHPTILKRRSIGNSLGGNSIDMMTITNFKTSPEDKKLILITARVHPGQTPSSFVMEGIINQLTQETPEMQNAREKFIFKLIPMLNPDGVINGNYRCSLSGYDLNRIWNRCDKDKFPEIFVVKKAIQSSKRPFLFIDLHAHSKKKGAFMYGCSIKNNPFLCRQIPFLLWKHISEFNYFQCNFSTSSRQRQGTARMNMFKEFGVSLSYTMQHSFCGPLKIRSHFSVQNYLSIGRNLVLMIEKFYGRRRKQNPNQVQDILKELYQNKELLKVGEGQDNESQSDSQLEEEFEVELDDGKEQNKKQQKSRPKQRLNFGQLKQNTVKTPRQSAYSNFNFTRSSSFRQKSISSQVRIVRKANCYVPISKIGFNVDDYFKGSEELRAESPDRNRDCYTSMRKEQEQPNKQPTKPAVRYSEEEINNLTNLFLPSVTSSSYKKYNKPKAQNKSIVHVGRKFLENAGILKEEIRSAMKRKIQWNTQNRNLLGN